MGGQEGKKELSLEREGAGSLSPTTPTPRPSKITMVTRRLREGGMHREVEGWGPEPGAFPTWHCAGTDFALWREKRKLRTREGIEMRNEAAEAKNVCYGDMAPSLGLCTS